MKERIRKSLSLIIVIALTLGVLSACTSTTNKPATNNPNDKVIEKVGSIEIKKSEFEINVNMFKKQYEEMNQSAVDWTQDVGGKTLIELAETQVLEALINNKVQILMAESNKIKTKEIRTLYDQAVKYYGGETKFVDFLKSLNMTDPQFKEIVSEQVTINKVKETLVGNLKATDAEALKYFNANASSYDEINAEHILLKTEAEANAVIKRLNKGEDFGKLAVELSTDPSAKTNKGELGFFKKGAMVAEFENAAFALKVNEISKPIQSQYGFHVIKLLAIKKAAFADHKVAILTQLNNEKQDTELQELITTFKKGIKITSYPENLK